MAAAFLAGALAALAMPPLYWLPLAVLGIVAFVWLWQTAPGPKSALLRGWAWGIGHFAVGSYWIVEAFFVPPADFALARRADRGGPGGASRLLPGPCGRRHTLAGRALAGAGRALSSPDPAGDRLDRDRMAARPPLHGISVESARPCLGLRHAVAARRRPVRRLWPGHADFSHAGGADRRLAGLDRGARGVGRRGLRRPEHDGSGDRRRTVAAHRAAQCRTGREVAAREPRAATRRAGRNEPAAGLRPPGGGGVARDGAAVRHRAGLARACDHGPGRAAGRLSPDRRGAQQDQRPEDGVWNSLLAIDGTGAIVASLRQGPSRAARRIHSVPQAARAGLRLHRPRLVRGGRGARHHQPCRPCRLSRR